MSTILMEKRGAIATVTLNRPEVLNALNKEMAVAFNETVDELATDESVRCVILKGAGRGFMAGGDVASFHAQLDTIEETIDDLISLFHQGVIGLSKLPKPVIGAVHGPAAGAGVSMALNCDYVIAADDAVFTMAYIWLGTIPDGGSTYLLPRIVGRRKALEMAMLSDPVDAQSAHDLGIVNKVVPAADLETATLELAERLASGPTQAYAGTKALINASFEAPSMADHLDFEKREFVKCTATQDFVEGVTAFVEKRKPGFSGN